MPAGGINIPLSSEDIGFFAGHIKRIGSGRYYSISSHNQKATDKQIEIIRRIWPAGLKDD